MAPSNIRNRGEVLIEIFDGYGALKTAIRKDNLIVDSGLRWYALRQLSNPPAVMSYMAAGINGSAPTAGQTSLLNERNRVVCQSSSPSGSAVTYTASFPAGTAPSGLAELGIFNAPSGGTMLNRVAFAAQTLGSQDSMRVTWSVNASN